MAIGYVSVRNYSSALMRKNRSPFSNMPLVSPEAQRIFIKKDKGGVDAR
jgi:hypothetical protein